MSARRTAKRNLRRAQLATMSLTRSWRDDPQKMVWAYNHSGASLVTDPKVQEEMIFNVFMGLIRIALTQTAEEMNRAFVGGEVDRRIMDDEITYATLTIVRVMSHAEWLAWANEFAPLFLASVEDTKRELGLL